VRIEAPSAPPGGFMIRAPAPSRGFHFARVNGREALLGKGGELIVRRAPAVVTLWP
jgi:hypothetical protein